MSSRRSPPRGNSGGFAFDVVADPSTMLAPVLDEDLVGIEPGGEDASDVHARHVRFHRFGRVPGNAARLIHRDRKSTRLNSSHSQISYAVFCLKKKKKKVTLDVIVSREDIAEDVI